MKRVYLVIIGAMAIAISGLLFDMKVHQIAFYVVAFLFIVMLIIELIYFIERMMK